MGIIISGDKELTSGGQQVNEITHEVRVPTFLNLGRQACFSTLIQSSQVRWSVAKKSKTDSFCPILQFKLDCVLNALLSLLQGSFVASMTGVLRQMDDYHYAHLISTFGKIRSDVVVSTLCQCFCVCWIFRPHCRFIT